MSIIRPILRMCVVAALRERTWAEDRVFDSDNTPLADALVTVPGTTKPYITVYTDEDTRTEIAGRDIYGATRNLTLVLEIGVASAVRVEGTDQVEIELPATDAGMELSVDMVETQALAALIGDPRSAWGELLRRIVVAIQRAPSQRGGSAEKGTRWAARQVVLVCDVIADPAPGTVLPEDHAVRTFITMAKTAPPELRLAGAGEIIENILNATATSSWEQAQAWLGLTEKAVRGIGVAPPLDVEEEVPLDQVTVSDEDMNVVTVANENASLP
jgi:hypothetical protein